MTAKQMRIEQMKELAKYQKKLRNELLNQTKVHEDYLKRDIVEIYSAMAVVLFKNGNSVDEISDLINQIQEEWTNHVTNPDREMGETMAEYCVKLTGIDLRQNVE